MKTFFTLFFLLFSIYSNANVKMPNINIDALAKNQKESLNNKIENIQGLKIDSTNKQDIGKRLAAIALHDIYKRDIVFSGPVFKSMEKKKTKSY